MFNAKRCFAVSAWLAVGFVAMFLIAALRSEAVQEQLVEAWQRHRISLDRSELKFWRTFIRQWLPWLLALGVISNLTGWIAAMSPDNDKLRGRDVALGAVAMMANVALAAWFFFMMFIGTGH